MGRRSNTGERKGQIMDGLCVVMARKGYDGASVAEIARVAGLTSGLLHYHFSSKKDMLLSLVRRLFVGVRDRYRRLAARSGRDPRGKLHAFLDAHLALGKGADADAVACWVAIGAEAVRDDEVRRAYRAVVDEQMKTLEGLIRDILRVENRPVRRVRESAAGILSAMEGAYRLALAAPGTVPPGSAARVVKEMAAGILGSSEGRRRRR